MCSVIERLMGALVVVVIDVAGDFDTGLVDVLKPVAPATPMSPTATPPCEVCHPEFGKGRLGLSFLDQLFWR